MRFAVSSSRKTNPQPPHERGGAFTDRKKGAGELAPQVAASAVRRGRQAIFPIQLANPHAFVQFGNYSGRSAVESREKKSPHRT
jgi:hypothetical protein